MTLTREGPPPLTAPDPTALPLLAQPAVAVFLGAAFGVGSLLVSRASSRFVTPEDPTLGFAKLAIVSTARMLVAVCVLAAYFFFARPGFMAFAITLIVSYLVTLGYEAYMASADKRRTTRSS